MMYDNPEDFLDTEKQKTKKQKRWCIKKALKLAEIKTTEQQITDMDNKDIVETAEKFNQFINQED